MELSRIPILKLRDALKKSFLNPREIKVGKLYKICSPINGVYYRTQLAFIGLSPVKFHETSIIDGPYRTIVCVLKQENNHVKCILVDKIVYIALRDIGEEITPNVSL